MGMFTIMLIIISLLVFYQFPNVMTNTHCKDENGNYVDWYILYKLPQIQESPHTLISEGLGYVHLSSASPSGEWSLSELSIGDDSSYPGNTLQGLYDSDSKSKLRVLYNDAYPNGSVSLVRGHTKGLIVFDERAGFWLVHSVPHYPPPASDGNYSYPHSGRLFGQSFLCISLPFWDADTVGQQLLYNGARVFDSNIPLAMKKLVPNLMSLLNHTTVTQQPWLHLAALTPVGGVNFISFAKCSKFGDDLYSSLIAPFLKTNLYSETWPNGAGRMPSNCSGYYIVENVEAVDFRTPARVIFSTSHDHSKWAISADGGKPWVCVGDINRMDGQTHRGGGSVCFRHKKAWSAFRNIVAALEKCNEVFRINWSGF